MKLIATLMLAGASMLIAGAASALDKPTGPILLTVEGQITNRNQGDKAVFDRAMLEKLGVREVRTTTTWTDGVKRFEGPTVKALLDAVGARGSQLRAVAINDYAIELDAAEFAAYPAILAMRMDGAELRIRDKGPIWIVYPRDEFPALRTEANNSKWIWQLKSLTVK